ncbi:MAG: SH3 domain-containing protein [Acidobacteriaceae bacterium]
MSSYLLGFRRRHLFALLLLPLLSAPVFVGCGRFSPHPHNEYVYVSARKAFLRERLAAVTNRVADLKNGERLLVVAQERRFYKVKTAAGALGWIDDLQVVTQADYDKFAGLAKEHAGDPVVVAGILRDESNLHIAPGRKSEHFYVLPENTHVQLLRRASTAKAMPPQAVPVPIPVAGKKADKKAAKKPKRDINAPPYVPAGPPMEDWWLVRGPQGQTGWVLSRMMDINIPQEIAGLAGTQKYVAAYRLATVEDPESKFPNGQAPDYVAVTNAWKQGLPYDFDQVHVFTWVTAHHRYELAFRQRGVEGYLPVTIGSGVFNGKTEPTFSFRQAVDNQAVDIDPVTGAARAANMETMTYRLEGNLVYRVGGPEAPKAAAKTAPGKVTKKRQPRRARRHARRAPRRGRRHSNSET